MELLQVVGVFLGSSILFRIMGPPIRQFSLMHHRYLVGTLRFSPTVIFWKLLSYCALGPGLWFLCAWAMHAISLTASREGRPPLTLVDTIPTDTYSLWLIGLIVSIVLYLTHVYSELLTRQPSLAVIVLLPIIEVTSALLWWRATLAGFFAAPILALIFVTIISDTSRRWSGAILD